MARAERHRQFRELPIERGPMRPTELAALTLVGAAALFVRVQGLADESAWGDEIFTLRHLDASSLSEFLRRTHGESPVPPLYMIFEFAWSRVFGTSVLAVRWLSVVFGMLGLTGLYVLTRMLVGWRAALIATTWTAFTFWHVYHSQEIRFYGLTTTLAVFAMIAFVRYVASESPRWLAVNALVSLAMIWSHPHSGLLFAAQGLFLVLMRRYDRRLVGAWIVAHLAVSLTLLVFYLAIDSDRALSITGWVPEPSLWGDKPSLAQAFFEFGGVRRLDATNAVGVWLAPLRSTIGVLFVLTQFAIAFAGWRYLRRGETPLRASKALLPTHETAVLLLLWLVMPPLLLFILSHAWRPMLLSRYVFYASFPLYILIGTWLGTRGRLVIPSAVSFLYESLIDGVPTGARQAFAAFVVVLFPIGYFLAFCFPGPIRTPFESAAEFIAAHDDHDVVVYVDDMFTAIPLKFYLPDRDLEFVTIVEADWMDEIVAGRVEPDGGYPWIALITPGRMRYWEKRLETAAVDYEIRRYESGRTLTMVRLYDAGDG